MLTILISFDNRAFLSQINKNKMNEDKIIPVCKNKTLTYNYIEGKQTLLKNPLSMIV